MFSTYFGLFILLIVMMMLYIYLSVYFTHLHQQTYNNTPFNTHNMNLIFERHGLTNCTETKLPCVLDEQCNENCTKINNLGTLECNEGFCQVRDPNVAGQPDDFDCNAEVGLIKVFIANEFVINQLCISTYRDVFDDFGKPRPYVCDNGTLSVNLTIRPFVPSNCVCLAGFTRMLFNQTSYARAVPVCIPNNLMSLFAKVYEQI
ncbi:PIF-3 [Urbanus proteus nucleopolyhedrovirus]|uniref:PIF-3 n=1 Tax=Urbanus proteus nucleopolyhedrovirus TaxID=1675866 RepID=A0A161C6Z0_9ABAC|nr:PIF-3 [Urbanus proteus nucleopolyhedrovirus]AKR17382.1 PIF-3 [Urbanus proteus nucleopolyhedrovirus]